MSVSVAHSHFVVLPTDGEPYIWTSFPKTYNRTDAGKLIRKIVQGGVAMICPDYVGIHGLFRRDCIRWDMAQRLLRCRGVKVYMNNNDTMVSANMAVLVDTTRIASSAPHLFGDILIHVSDTQLRSKGINPDQLRVINPIDEDGEPTPFDFEDDAELEAKQAECVVNGWDSCQLENTGIIYKMIV